MKATEFRVGNIVTIDNLLRLESGLDLTVIGIGEDWLSLKSDIDDFGQFFKFVRPIPITKERLLSFGFYQENDMSEYRLILSDRDLIFDLEQGALGNYCSTENSTEWICEDIYNVHQLQNLYHSLTSEELEIKELV